MESRSEHAQGTPVPVVYGPPRQAAEEAPRESALPWLGAGEPDRPQPHVEEPKPFWRRAGGLLIAAALLIAKFGAKLKGLLLLLPKLKIFTTSASMLVSVGAYALFWGWKFAVGFVLLLFVHEMGHALQARREGLPVSAPIFVPFLGAAILMKKMPQDAAVEARIGLGGPILGSLGCLVPVALYAVTGNLLFQALAFVGFFLNLINLMPVLPLDGGRAMAVMGPWAWVIGFGLFLGLAIAFPNPIILLIVLLGGLETWRRFRARNSPEGKRYRDVRARTRFAVAAVYLGLAVLLSFGMQQTFVEQEIGEGPAITAER